MALAEEEALGEEASSPEIRQRRKERWEDCKSEAVTEGLKRKGCGERRSPPKAKLPRPES